jgi:hypothetical protein
MSSKSAGAASAGVALAGCVLAGAVLAVAVLATAARAEAPLSAIDWLSQSVATPAALPAPQPDEPQVSSGALPQDVAVSSLDAPAPDATGLLPPQVTGLPAALWGLGRTDEIAALIASERTDTLPALKALLTAILLAEAEAPADAAGRGTLLLARVDKLLDLGALGPAAALLDKAGSRTRISRTGTVAWRISRSSRSLAAAGSTGPSIWPAPRRARRRPSCGAPGTSASKSPDRMAGNT